MYQKFTQDYSDYCELKKNVLFGLPKPKRDTLSAIKQFARAYYVEKRLQGPLSEMILN